MTGWYSREVKRDAAGRRIFTIEDIAKIIAAEKHGSVPIENAN
jgi:hypothetical protein